MQNLRWKLITIVGVFVLLAAVGVYPTVATRFGISWPSWLIERQLKLGLDLKGGVHLVLRVQTDDALRIETEAESERHTDDCELRALRQDQPHDGCGRGTQCDSHAELGDALTDRVGHHAVNAGQREQQRGAREDHDQERPEAGSRRCGLEPALHRRHSYRHVGAAARDRPADGVGQGQRLHRIGADDQVERRGEVLDRVVVRGSVDGLLGREPEVGDGLGGVAALPEVMRELAAVVLEARRVERFDGVRNALVQRPPPLGEQRPVRHDLRQDVLEGVAGPSDRR